MTWRSEEEKGDPKRPSLGLSEGSRVHRKWEFRWAFRNRKGCHYCKEGWISGAGGTLTFEFPGILRPHFSILMFTLWSFLCLIYLLPLQGTEAEHSEGFKGENRSAFCGEIHSCGQKWWWHALSYLRGVSSYKSIGNGALIVFSQALIIEVSSSWSSSPGAPWLHLFQDCLCSFPWDGKSASSVPVITSFCPLEAPD